MTTLAVDLSGFDALDPASAAALTEPTADLSALIPAAAAEVSALAADIGRSVAANLGGSAGGATATCVWREADPAKVNLLTLAESCEATRLRRLGRRLQQAGFGVTLELAGDAAALAGSDPAALAGALEGPVAIRLQSELKE